MKILIIGGTGVFGSRLARLLLDAGFDVIISGRNAARVTEVTRRYGGQGLVMDRAELCTMKSGLRAGDVVVDASGPFQELGDHHVARRAIEMGCHYLDLADDARFVQGITSLDEAAQRAGVTVLSGLSSVPALSSAVVTELAPAFKEITLIETAILPGNRAPRGRSVIRAILSQIGRPLRQWRGGVWMESPAWSGQRRYGLPNNLSRVASPIGAPDLVLMPEHFGARSVRFAAGVELAVMHQSLRLLGWCHRKGVLRNPERFEPILHTLANRLQPFGSDQGGMVVRVAGRDGKGTPLTRGWRLHIGQGLGPFIPAIPGLVMINHLASGQGRAGARPALGCFPLAEAESVITGLGGSTDQHAPLLVPLFEDRLGPGQWAAMPASYREMHDLWDYQKASGQARITRGKHPLSRLIAAAFGFPKAADAVPLTVTMERIGAAEHWTRDFGGKRFRSVLSPSTPGRVIERFGALSFELDLPVSNQQMGMPVMRGWLLGVIPLPKAFLPRSETREFDKDGRFHFDVEISVPLGGLVVRYQGSLAPLREDHSAASFGGSDGSLPLG